MHAIGKPLGLTAGEAAYVNVAAIISHSMQLLKTKLKIIPTQHNYKLYLLNI